MLVLTRRADEDVEVSGVLPTKLVERLIQTASLSEEQRMVMVDQLNLLIARQVPIRIRVLNTTASRARLGILADATVMVMRAEVGKLPPVIPPVAPRKPRDLTYPGPANRRTAIVRSGKPRT